ncbi:MAG TPA: L-dopachrome tautomerase-related protein, partial [Thermoanaerobaculia bacterium]
GGQTPSSAAGSSGAAALKAIGRFDDVPVGIAVSRDGRIFFAMSRAIDEKEPFSVAEWKSGTLTPFPPGFRQDRGAPDATRLLSVQALTVDARNRLWMLDCGRIDNDDAQPGSAKLVAVDLGSNRAAQTIAFPAAVAGATSFPNDVVVDLKRGSGGVAFLTDASPKGPNGLLVVDLATGTVRRRLNDHPSTRPAPGFIAQVEGRPLVFKSGPTAGQPLRIGADGIALDSDGRHLFYSPLSSRHWYRVDADALADPGRGDEEIARTVEDLGDKGFASDGMLGTADGRVS